METIRPSTLVIKKLTQYSADTCTHTHSQTSLSFEFGCSKHSGYQEANAIFNTFTHTHTHTAQNSTIISFNIGYGYNM